MATIVQCPTCRATVVFEESPFRPFCSERCKVIDLGAWAEEKYRIAGESSEQDSLPEEKEGSREKRKRPN
jgi:endogenous inhibitor of DNA gyrase (YacG/DUF329 family)